MTDPGTTASGEVGGHARRRRLPIATAAVVLFVMLGQLLPARGLFLVVRGGQGDEDLGLPVTIIDRAGIVAGVEDASVDLESAPITGLPGRSNSIVYRWLGGLCDRAVSIRVDRDGRAISLLRIDEVTGSSCLLTGISRSIVIEFREPVDPTTVVDWTNVLF